MCVRVVGGVGWWVVVVAGWRGGVVAVGQIRLAHAGRMGGMLPWNAGWRTDMPLFGML